MMSNDQLNLHEEELLASQLYSANFYTDHALPPGSGNHVGETRGGRRRRKKNKGDGVNGGKKRKLSEEQVNMLEMNFGNEHKLESERKDRLALELGLDPRQVAVWFQNRRARWKSKKLEEEYSKLKSAHETAIVEKCRLEAEVLKLKERLSEAEKEIQRLSERSEGMSSPCSSFSMDANSHFLDDYAVEQYDTLFCVPDYSCYVHGSMDYNWSNICGF